jgi:hypothetical protein
MAAVLVNNMDVSVVTDKNGKSWVALAIRDSLLKKTNYQEGATLLGFPLGPDWGFKAWHDDSERLEERFLTSKTRYQFLYVAEGVNIDPCAPDLLLQGAVQRYNEALEID